MVRCEPGTTIPELQNSMQFTNTTREDAQNLKRASPYGINHESTNDNSDGEGHVFIGLVNDGCELSTGRFDIYIPKPEIRNSESRTCDCNAKRRCDADDVTMSARTRCWECGCLGWNYDSCPWVWTGD